MNTIPDQPEPRKGKKARQPVPLHPNPVLAAEGLSATFLERFWPKVKKVGDCWIWIGAITKGYGNIRRGSKTAGMIRASAASWLIHKGPIPDGLWVLHNCPGGDNPACVNPDHLWLGTAAENSQDRDSKGRWHPGYSHPGIERWNHKLTPQAAKIIREEYAQGNVSHRSLARRFGVGHTTIVACLKGRTWKLPTSAPTELRLTRRSDQ